METLVDFLKNITERHGLRPALKMRPRWRTVSWNYQHLGNFAAAVSDELTSRKVSQGDRVILMAPNSPYWVGAFFGILLRGAVVVPLNPQSTKDFVTKVRQATAAKLILGQPELNKWSAGLFSKGAGQRRLGSVPVRAEDIAEIVYTSGTTGDPKGVALTHKNLLTNLAALQKVAEIRSQDRFLSLLPLFHMFEQMVGLFLPLAEGCQIVYLSNLSSPRILEALEENKITRLVAVPEFLKTMMSRLQASGGKALQFLPRIFWPAALRHLETIASGGAPLDPELEKKWRALGMEILSGYGLTETSPVLTVNTKKEQRIGSAGKPLPGVQIKISGESEVLAKGPNVFSGYYKDPTRTKAAFSNGWFRTDDAGHFDKDGFLYVAGRKKYMILGPSGENIFPEDIETELNKQPGVKESAVVGWEKFGRTQVLAVLLLEPKTDAEKIVSQANKQLASYQQIQGYRLWPEPDFPRSATRKVRKEEVLQWLGGEKEEMKKGQSFPTDALVKLLAEVTAAPPETIKEKTKIISDLNLDSLARVELVARLEEQFNVLIDETKIGSQTTVRQLRQFLEKGREGPVRKFNRWPFLAPAAFIRDLLQQLILFPYLRFFLKIKVIGWERLKALPAPVIFMSNHLSYLDTPIILYALLQRWREKLAPAAATDVLYEKYRFWAPLVDLVFSPFPFPRRQSEPINQGLDSAGRLLDQGISLLFFPEGKISQSGRLLPLKAGTGLVAVAMASPVVPIKLKGLRPLVEPTAFVPKKRGEVEVIFGEPLYFSPQTSYQEALEQIRKKLC